MSRSRFGEPPISIARPAVCEGRILAFPGARRRHRNYFVRHNSSAAILLTRLCCRARNDRSFGAVEDNVGGEVVLSGRADEYRRRACVVLLRRYSGTDSLRVERHWVGAIQATLLRRHETCNNRLRKLDSLQFVFIHSVCVWVWMN